jgi:hypothetical protein
MFHTLFDSEDQNIDFNIQAQKSKKTDFNNGYHFDIKNSLYFGKGNKAIDTFNKRKNSINTVRYTDQKLEKSKTKIKVVIYQNGFFVNNGEFRNTSIIENKRFLNEIEKGNIPNELIKKGIFDAEIELENRKNEVYYSTSYQNSYNNFDISELFQNSAQFQYQDPYLYSYFANGDYKPNNELILPKRKMTMTINSRNQIKNFNQRQNPLYSTNTLKVNNKYRNKENNKAKTIQKKENNFVDFLEFKKENDNKKKEKKEEKKEKFKAFSGFGQLIDNINTEGLYVNKTVNTSANIYSPVCQINIRLFNGEVIKANFNYDQTVGDIYVYVRKVSGSNNFVLLGGFPPKEITSYGTAIYELGLQNTVITQKIK